MLPNIDVTVGAGSTAATTAAAATATAPAPRRAEGERGLEAYRSARAAPEKTPGADPVLPRTEAAGGGAAAVAAPEKKPTDRLEKKDPGKKPAGQGDSVDIALQLTREERDALASAFGDDTERARMTPEEKETAQKASERITRYLDEAIARKRESRERMEKAVTEWYSRLSKGTDFGPTDLVSLFRQAAAGQLDDVTASGA